MEKSTSLCLHITTFGEMVILSRLSWCKTKSKMYKNQEKCAFYRVFLTLNRCFIV